MGILSNRISQLLLATMFLAHPMAALASDHDDGEMDLKGRSVNLTDVYAFREDWQTANGADSQNLILIMNSNPRSLPRQQYYFSSQARYEFHITRVGTNNDSAVTGRDDVLVRVTFSDPDSQLHQKMIVTVISEGKKSEMSTDVYGNDLLTTNLVESTADAADSLKVHTLAWGGKPWSLFAGLREDPFFFDVEKFFKLRAYAAGSGPASTFATSAANACDFTHGYNVNSIALRVPLSVLKGATGSTVFDVWATVSVPTSKL